VGALGCTVPVLSILNQKDHQNVIGVVPVLITSSQVAL
jgi:hypothetical protein